MFLGIMCVAGWSFHLFFILSAMFPAIQQGEPIGVVKLTLDYNRFNEMIIEMWLILVIVVLSGISTIHLYRKGVD